MGYWVINKHLESHLLISEGHPWGICDPLSRPQTLHTWSVCTIPQVFIHTSSVLLSPSILLLTQASSSPGIVLGILWIDFDLGILWIDFVLLHNLTNPFLAAAWEKKLLTANSSEGSWQCLQRTDLTLCQGLFSSEGFSFGLEGKQGSREEEQWQNSPQLTNYSCSPGWLTKGNSECQEPQKESSEQEVFRREKSKIPNCVGTETQSSFTR